MGVPYDFREIEQRWRERWEEAGLHHVDLDTVNPSRLFYNLVEFPYPSAEGLHVGHIFKYSGADAYGRYQRMLGKAVFQPIGFDAFGIHTENYALKAGPPPLGPHAADDRGFSRPAVPGRHGLGLVALCRHEPAWLLPLDPVGPHPAVRGGALYQADAPVVWCPSCLTVLAREQTEVAAGGGRLRALFDARHRAADAPVVPADHFLRRAALGRPGRPRLAGAGQAPPTPVDRAVRGPGGRLRGPDCVHDSAGHPSGRHLPGGAGRPPCCGSCPAPPAQRGDLPVLAADYVIESYGTGAVMGVPAHDERDRRFAVAHSLPISDAPLLEPGQAELDRPAGGAVPDEGLVDLPPALLGPADTHRALPVCGPVAVPEEELPVLLPEVDDFRPTGTGRSPLAAVRGLRP